MSSSIENFSAPTSIPYLIPSPSSMTITAIITPPLPRPYHSFGTHYPPSIMHSFTPTELLGAHNYVTWSKEVKAYCMTQQGGDIWLAIDPDTEVPTTTAKLTGWKKVNTFAYNKCSALSTQTIGTSSVTSLQPNVATQPGPHFMPTTSRIPPLTVSVSVNSSTAFPTLRLRASLVIQILLRVLSVIFLTSAYPIPS
jgi:hypothetical protein